MLENYLQGVESDTTIQGSTDSTDIESLQLAMSHIRLSPVKIPALHQNLITSASLIFPTDIARTGIASTTFVLANPFTASINLLEVNAVATFGNLSLGSIDHVDRSGSPIHADGHSNVTSPTLPFVFNLDPVAIIELLLTGAKNNGVDLGPLPDVFQVVLADPGAKTSVRCGWCFCCKWLADVVAARSMRLSTLASLHVIGRCPCCCGSCVLTHSVF